METTLENLQSRPRSIRSTELSLALLQEGDLATIQTEDSKVYNYTFVGRRSGNDLRFARRISPDAISRLSFAPSDVLLYLDRVYRGNVIQANIVKGESTDYSGYDETLRRFNR